MNNLKQIEKINNSLIEVRDKYELEIEELLEQDLRRLTEMFNNDNKGFCELYICAGMGGCTFYLDFKDKNLDSLNETYNFNLNGIKDINSILLHDYEYKDNKIKLSKEFTNFHKDLINTINVLEKGFFKLDHANFDTRIPPVYKTLKNNINLDVNDENFLKLISSQHDSISWKYDTESKLFYKTLHDFYPESASLSSKNLFFQEAIANEDFSNFHNMVKLNSKLILESNLFNDVKKDFGINTIEEIKNRNFDIASISLNKGEKDYFDNLHKELLYKYNLSSIYKTLFVALELGKPSELKTEKEQKDFLKLTNNHYATFKELFENDTLFKKIETLDFNEIKQEFDKKLIFNFEIKNKITNETYQKSFNGYEDMLNYINNDIKEIELNR